MSHSEIAGEGLGYSADEIGRIIRDRMEREVRHLDGETRKSLVALEVARLDALQAALWPRAMRGDEKAISEVRQLILARVKVLGLDLADVSSATTVLVIRGDEEEYIELLKEAAVDKTSKIEAGG